jgi:hypothetical protein
LRKEGCTKEQADRFKTIDASMGESKRKALGQRALEEEDMKLERTRVGLVMTVKKTPRTRLLLQMLAVAGHLLKAPCAVSAPSNFLQSLRKASSSTYTCSGYIINPEALYEEPTLHLTTLNDRSSYGSLRSRPDGAWPIQEVQLLIVPGVERQSPDKTGEFFERSWSLSKGWVLELSSPKGLHQTSEKIVSFAETWLENKKQADDVGAELDERDAKSWRLSGSGFLHWEKLTKAERNLKKLQPLVLFVSTGAGLNPLLRIQPGVEKKVKLEPENFQKLRAILKQHEIPVEPTLRQHLRCLKRHCSMKVLEDIEDIFMPRSSNPSKTELSPQALAACTGCGTCTKLDTSVVSLRSLTANDDGRMTDLLVLGKRDYNDFTDVGRRVVMPSSFEETKQTWPLVSVVDHDTDRLSMQILSGEQHRRVEAIELCMHLKAIALRFKLDVVTDIKQLHYHLRDRLGGHRKERQSRRP